MLLSDRLPFDCLLEFAAVIYAVVLFWLISCKYISWLPNELHRYNAMATVQPWSAVPPVLTEMTGLVIGNGNTTQLITNKFVAGDYVAKFAVSQSTGASLTDYILQNNYFDPSTGLKYCNYCGERMHLDWALNLTWHLDVSRSTALSARVSNK